MATLMFVHEMMLIQEALQAAYLKSMDSHAQGDVFFHFNDYTFTVNASQRSISAESFKVKFGTQEWADEWVAYGMSRIPYYESPRLTALRIELHQVEEAYRRDRRTILNKMQALEEAICTKSTTS